MPVPRSWSRPTGSPSTSTTRTVVVVESDEDVLLYDVGHIPGAVKVDWHTELNDPLIRDYLDPEAFAALMSAKGITRDDTVVFYGDNFNWWAAYALWVFGLFGHADARLLDGGRQKWVAEGGPMTTERAGPRSHRLPGGRATRRRRSGRSATTCSAHLDTGGPLVDVRSPQEYRGELLHMPDYPQEGALRGGHIPGAPSVPWKRAANDDGTFKAADELRAIYQDELGLEPGRRGDRLLPHRGAVEPHVVRAHPPARLRERCATTTAHGPSGATSSGCPSSVDGRAIRVACRSSD